uniref:Uncharacterized protein n=1 Tax=Chenopodium quinoa TaxID=63459 RepID=A0A803LXZ2_CHEQI
MFRYTPITVFEEKKKQLTAKGVAGEDKSGETDQYAEKAVIDSEDIYGLLDINTDLMGVRQGTTSDSDLIYTRRSHSNLGLHLENKNTQSGGSILLKGFVSMTSYALVKDGKPWCNSTLL